MGDHHRWVERAARRLPRTTRGLVLTAGVAFGATGGVIGTAIVSLGVVPGVLDSAGATPGALGIAAAVAGGAGLGAAVAGGALWWLAIERPGEVSLLRGGLVGVAVGLLAHPLMWVFAGTGVGATVLVLEGPAVLAGVGPEAIWAAFLGFFLFTFFGMLFTGIVTVPVAVATGVALAHVRGAAEDLDRQRHRHV